MSSCLQGLRVLLTDLGSDQQTQAEQLASKLGATLIPAVSNTLPDVLVAGRAGSVTCKVTKVLPAAPLPGPVLPRTTIAYLTLQNVRQAKDVPVVSPAWLEGCARAGVQASPSAPMSGDITLQPALKLPVCSGLQFLCLSMCQQVSKNSSQVAVLWPSRKSSEHV